MEHAPTYSLSDYQLKLLSDIFRIIVKTIKSDSDKEKLAPGELGIDYDEGCFYIKNPYTGKLFTPNSLAHINQILSKYTSNGNILNADTVGGIHFYTSLTQLTQIGTDLTADTAIRQMGYPGLLYAPVNYANYSVLGYPSNDGVILVFKISPEATVAYYYDNHSLNLFLGRYDGNTQQLMSWQSTSDPDSIYAESAGTSLAVTAVTHSDISDMSVITLKLTNDVSIGATLSVNNSAPHPITTMTGEPLSETIELNTRIMLIFDQFNGKWRIVSDRYTASTAVVALIRERSSTRLNSDSATALLGNISQELFKVATYSLVAWYDARDCKPSDINWANRIDPTSAIDLTTFPFDYSGNGFDRSAGYLSQNKITTNGNSGTIDVSSFNPENSNTWTAEFNIKVTGNNRIVAMLYDNEADYQTKYIMISSSESNAGYTIGYAFSDTPTPNWLTIDNAQADDVSVFTIVRNGKYMYFYYNGTLKGTLTLPAESTGFGYLTVGGWAKYTGPYKLSSIRLYDGILSADEVLANYNYELYRNQKVLREDESVLDTMLGVAQTTHALSNRIKTIETASSSHYELIDEVAVTPDTQPITIPNLKHNRIMVVANFGTTSGGMQVVCSATDSADPLITLVGNGKAIRMDAFKSFGIWDGDISTEATCGKPLFTGNVGDAVQYAKINSITISPAEASTAFIAGAIKIYGVK